MNLIDRDKIFELLNERSEKHKGMNDKRGDTIISEIIRDVASIPIKSMPTETPQEDKALFEYLERWISDEEYDIKRSMGNNKSIGDYHSGALFAFTRIKNYLLEQGGHRDSQEDKQTSPDRRCGTCVNFTSRCVLGWIMVQGTRDDKGTLIPIVSYYTKENDGASCHDWRPKEPEKPKERMRVWICSNCGKDIFYEGRFFYHFKSCNVRCNIDVEKGLENMAIPKPDSERWVER